MGTQANEGRATRAGLGLILVCLAGGCAGWVPFAWADYGRGDGFTESQWLNEDANVGDLDRWSAGVGFAYGGFLPGLMESRLPPPLPPLLGPDPVEPDDGPTQHDEVWHFLDWFAKLGPWALLVLCVLVLGLAFMFRDRIKGWLPRFGKNGQASPPPD